MPALRLVGVFVLLAVTAADGTAAATLNHQTLERALAACLEALDATARTTGSIAFPEGAPAPADYLRRQHAASAVKPENCVGYAAEVCMASDEDGSSTLGAAACVRREATAWESRLNASYKKLMVKVGPNAREAYRRAERSWIGYRDAMCSLPAARLGTHDRVVPLTANCMLDQTARQALWLDAEIAQLE